MTPSTERYDATPVFSRLQHVPEVQTGGLLIQSSNCGKIWRKITINDSRNVCGFLFLFQSFNVSLGPLQSVGFNKPRAELIAGKRVEQFWSLINCETGRWVYVLKNSWSFRQGYGINIYPPPRYLLPENKFFTVHVDEDDIRIVRSFMIVLDS